jgi:hypothetical protein
MLAYIRINLYSRPVRQTATSNEGISAASFCHQVAAWFPDMFSNFYLVKNHKIAKKNTTTAKPREKNKHSFVILGVLENF